MKRHKDLYNKPGSQYAVADDDMQIMLGTLQDLGWKTTRDQHGNWTLTNPNGEESITYHRITTDTAGRLIRAETGTEVALTYGP